MTHPPNTIPIPPLSDPNKIGPGIWYSLHRQAKKAKTPEQKQRFIEDLRALSEEFPCEKCRIHFKAYLETHPPETFLHVKSASGEDIGMFKWTWMFHNAVNTRLGKPIVDWDTADGMFSNPNSAVCTKGCGEESIGPAGSVSTGGGITLAGTAVPGAPPKNAALNFRELSMSLPGIIQPVYSGQPSGTNVSRPGFRLVPRN